MGKVKIMVSGTEQSTTTDDNGVFVLEKLPTGRVDLHITTVSYGLVKKTISLKEGDNSEIQIALNEEAAALTEQVSVVADPYDTGQASVAAAQTLNKRELQTLSSILVGDPLRAAQSLPGVTAHDDARSEFSVRGAGFDRIGLYLDGILAANFVHMVGGNYPNAGSLSVINAYTVDSVPLMSGAFPATCGDRTGAILDIR
jgi:hypothetical protein